MNVRIYEEPEHVEEYLRALLDLRVQYKKWVHLPKVSSCPLCQVAKKHSGLMGAVGFTDCRTCPWAVLTEPYPTYFRCHSAVFYKKGSLSQKSKLLRRFKFLREFALLWNRSISKRIEELELWISIYSRYLFYTKSCWWSAQKAMDTINTQLKEGTFKCL